ncbi:CUN051 hypothetical protein [Culex nigripalpus nucleopolyhedrovirus]|uniref:Uncharacterized protein n=1 Tax=Culex nigripalpus nucleopolyhedrovirus (isolate Florida/1997) TaxID=645993 RepID=Q919M4_NPVCO|nr:CUN051 hypothetical protein [Culex nigripalpus nucleopolyhedrovirus]AAK94129.1 CUN051 hypothetical protein [Culex nigripalpus nucleopolyhedrovirus]
MLLGSSRAPNPTFIYPVIMREFKFGYMRYLCAEDCGVKVSGHTLRTLLQATGQSADGVEGLDVIYALAGQISAAVAKQNKNKREKL